MAKYLDDNGLLYFWQKIKTYVSTVLPTKTSDLTNDSGFITSADVPEGATASTTTPKMDGTAAVGSETAFARGDHVHPSDTTKVDKVSGKGLSTNDFTSTLLTKLNGIASGAEVNVQSDWNQTTTTADDYIKNKPSNATTTVGGLMSATDKAHLDALDDRIVIESVDEGNFYTTLNLVYADTAGSEVTSLDVLMDSARGVPNGVATLNANGRLNPDQYVDTKNTAGAGASTSKLFIIGAISQGDNPQTYSRSSAYIGTDGHLYSNSIQCVNLSGSQALTNKTYNGYTLAAACAKGVDTSIASGSTSTNVPTTAAVETRIANAIAAAQVGASMFQGTVAAQSTITNSAYKKGWYWVVSTAGTYVGQSCEVGDMIFAIADKGSSYSAADFSVVQNNIVTITNGEIDTIIAS